MLASFFLLFLCLGYMSCTDIHTVPQHVALHLHAKFRKNPLFPPLRITGGSAPSRLCLLLLAGDIALNPGPNCMSTPQLDCTLAITNIRSITNQGPALHQHISSHSVDLFALSETWLKPEDTTSLLSELTPHGYKLYHRPRPIRRGGGVGLQRIQNSLVRIVLNKSRYCHVSPLLKELHWLPVKYRISFKQCLLIYKTLDTGLPYYFTSWFLPYSCSANTRRGEPSNKILKTAVYKRSIHKSTRHFDAAFSVLGPNCWNKLPLVVRCSDSTAIFRSRLKSYLFSLAFPP